MPQGWFKEVSRACQDRFQCIFLEVLMVFQSSFHGISWKFQWCFQNVFQLCFNHVSRKFQENVQGVSKKFHVACHSSHLTEQKECLFITDRQTDKHTLDNWGTVTVRVLTQVRIGFDDVLVALRDESNFSHLFPILGFPLEMLTFELWEFCSW